MTVDAAADAETVDVGFIQARPDQVEGFGLYTDVAVRSDNDIAAQTSIAAGKVVGDIQGIE